MPSEARSAAITLLFTDIEGSTRLWEIHPKGMVTALERHDVLLRGAIEAHGGNVFKTVGDAFCAAFDSALDAVSAAAGIQASLEREAWTDVPELRVRIGLHTGEVVERDRDFFGPSLNRCARLMSIGHGQQILLSAATYELVRDDLPEGASLLDLGDHRLRDLARSERVYQVSVSGLRDEFPPLRSLDTFATNLPIRRTRFVGREQELATVKGLVEQSRMVTLTGAGGSGKTRLALQVAADLLEAFPDGVWWVDLAPLEDPGLVPQTAAAALGLRRQPECPIEDTLIHYLADKRLMLLLDNCEHVIDAAARLAETMLSRCPDVTVLATSREELGVEAEQARVVPTLAAPSVDDVALADLERLAQYEAVQLFVDRALAVRQDFAVDNDNAPAVAEVCHRLDGIPLAIELAAARLAVLTPDEILKRLESRFRLLTGGPRTSLPRQRTLLATLEWSYDLLSEAEQTLLRRLSVFHGGWTLVAAEKVCSGDAVALGDMLDLLTALTQKSMVVVDHDGLGGRFGMLETVREFGAERLIDEGESNIVHEQHAAYYADLVVHAKDTLGERARLFNTEFDNIRAVFRWSQAGGRPELGLRMAGSTNLRSFWDNSGYYDEGYATVKRLLESSSGDDISSDSAAAMITADLLASRRGDLDEALTLSRHALAAYEELGDRLGTARALMALGNCAQVSHDMEGARRLHHKSLAMFREEGDATGTASQLRHIAMVESATGNQKGAKELLQESLAMSGPDWDSDWNRMMCLVLLAQGAMFSEGDLSKARNLLEESLVLAHKIGYELSSGLQLFNLGAVAMYEAEFVVANEYLDECVADSRRRGSRNGERMGLRFLGIVAAFRGDHVTARDRLEEGLRLDRDAGDTAQLPYSLCFLGLAARGLNDPIGAARYLEEALEVAEATSNLWLLGWVHAVLGVLAADCGDPAGGRHQLDLGLEELATWSDPYGVALARTWRADVAIADGAAAEATELLERALTVSHQCGYRLLISQALDGYAQVASLAGDHTRALRLAGASAAIRDAIDARRAPIDRDRVRARLAASASALGDEAAANATQKGGSLSQERAVAYALGEAGWSRLEAD